MSLTLSKEESDLILRLRSHNEYRLGEREGLRVACSIVSDEQQKDFALTLWKEVDNRAISVTLREIYPERR